MSQKLQGKTVVITGASSGFGAAISKAFAIEKCRLVLIARRADRLEELSHDLRKEHGVEVTNIELDVSDYGAVVDKLQSINADLLINNAGTAKGLGKMWEVTPEEWNTMIDTNVKGVLNVTSQLLPKMIKANKGHIINIGSISGYDTYPGGGVYCATKFALRALTDTLRKELVATPIRVSAISPGLANTEFSIARFSGDKTKAAEVYKDFKALTAEDIAEMVVFIATRPRHVDIADIIVFPTHQASVSLVHRQSK